MIHGGSSSILARGQRQSGTDRPGWTVGIQHPLRPDRRLLELQLCDRAVGTSGAGTHQFFVQGQALRPYPRPASPAIRPRACCRRRWWPLQAADSDALSTAFYVLGVEPTQRFCEQHPDVAALITTAGRRSGSRRVARVQLRIARLALRPDEHRSARWCRSLATSHAPVALRAAPSVTDAVTRVAPAAGLERAGGPAWGGASPTRRCGARLRSTGQEIVDLRDFLQAIKLLGHRQPQFLLADVLGQLVADVVQTRDDRFGLAQVVQDDVPVGDRDDRRQRILFGQRERLLPRLWVGR